MSDAPGYFEDYFAGYVAGFVDGEGCIRCRWTSEGANGVTITVVNTFLPVLEAIQGKLGFGSIRKRKKYNERWTQQYSLTFSSFDHCSRLLDIIEPYLIVKAKDAKIVRDHIAMRRESIRLLTERNFSVRESFKSGKRQVDIAKELGIPKQTVCRIIHGHRWNRG